jgi:hypothetical protein
MQIDESMEQFENAATNESVEPDSNATFERFMHSLKQATQSVSTKEGTKRDEIESQHANAAPSMRSETEPTSNVTAARLVHRPKQHSRSVSTEAGMQIDESDGHSRKAEVGIDERFDPNSKVTIERWAQLQKH